MERNVVYCGDWMDNTLPDKSVQLIIADPPYFEIKGHFDYVWPSFDAYLADVERWAVECKRVLADNGTLFWWGDDKRLAYSQVVFDRHFELINNMVWWKRNLRGGMYGASASSVARSFANCTERLLMYANAGEPEVWARTGWENVKLDTGNFGPLRDYFKRMQEFIGIGLKKINDRLGHRKAEHAFYWGSTQWDLPTPETYGQLIEVFGIDKWEGFRGYDTIKDGYQSLRQEYEDLRREYEDLRRPFNNRYQQTEVLDYETEKAKKYAHPTVKPLDLTRSLVATCSRPGDLVLVPFAGSGTECEAAAIEGRDFIGFDIEQKYVDMANERVRPHLTQPNLFYARTG